ncbi:uncharacterized protein LAESUDRAFT_721241 [Laetiporus sulphureus 93-53]|uniref:Uncharacterized protein n=1 Tax=Laetiporus sulphureus 93-53 TaxID=1314785 RepID=A0A165GUZ0_9APHY|nr:uncharacterized protein LAESUDRAFT_721241 [Laetiporus sulphureus 93-53]KZT10849.1 hypothetical protein LAESUDRAFT_721241 [Laetiporus sulphureus 93-53]
MLLLSHTSGAGHTGASRLCAPCPDSNNSEILYHCSSAPRSTLWPSPSCPRPPDPTSAWSHCPSAALQPSHLGDLPQLPAFDLPTGLLTSQHPGPPAGAS